MINGIITLPGKIHVTQVEGIESTLNEKDYYIKQYLTFEAIETGTFTLTIGTNVSTSYVTSISYSLDNGKTWTTTNNVDNQTVTITTPTIAVGDKVLWKGIATALATTAVTLSLALANRPPEICVFTSTGTYNVSGNIMSLLYGDDFEDKDYFAAGSSRNFALLFYGYSEIYSKIVSSCNLILPARVCPDYCYYRMFQLNSNMINTPKFLFTSIGEYGASCMFYSCTSLVLPPELTATTLHDNCYYCTFYGCTSLTKTPKFPSLTLATNCYRSMFMGCSGLKESEDLLAPTIPEYAYKWMFQDCTSLIKPPKICGITVGKEGYEAMFLFCTSLIVAPKLIATSYGDLACRSMFRGCTSLIDVPDFEPATLDRGAFCFMFQDCSSLKKAPKLLSTNFIGVCVYQDMFQGCTSLTVAPELPATTLTNSCYQNMFYGCTSLKKAPELPVSSIAATQYKQMFYGCTSLNYIKCLATSLTVTNDSAQELPTANWTTNVAATGIFVKADSMSDWTTGASGIPSGWTVYTESEWKEVKHYEIASMATLDANGKIPSTQLPSYVDDVIEGYYNNGNFYSTYSNSTYSDQITGETGKIYVDLGNGNKSYRWSGSAYVEIVASPGSTDNIVEGSTNLWNKQADWNQTTTTAGDYIKNKPTIPTHWANVTVGTSANYITEPEFKSVKINGSTTNAASSDNLYLIDMALQVWLPLNGNLNNQGLSNVIVINNGATIDDNGKIGQCYSFSGSSYLSESTFDWSNFNVNQFSLCCWYKEPSVAAGNSQILCIGTNSGWNNIRIGLLRRTSNGYPMFSVSDGTNNVNYNFTATTFPLNVWNHIAVTYDSGKLKMYINGILNKEGTTTIVPALNSSQHLGIGAASNGAEKLLGYLNDVRIYDHALSPKEVKEISRGLILHYKLNNVFYSNENLLPIDSQRMTENGQTSSNDYMSLCDPLSVYETYGLVPYIVSFDIKAAVSRSFLLYGSPGSNFKYNFSSKYINVTTEWTRVSYTFTPYLANESGTWASISVYGTYGSGAVVSVRRVKLELGNFETSTMQDSDYLKDTSGYKNNGTAIGTFTIENNSPRYNSAIYMDNTNTSNHIEVNKISCPDNIRSISFWVKCSKSKNQVLVGDPNVLVIGLLNNLIYINPGSASPFSTTNFITNEWNHIVAIRNGTSYSLYINGQPEVQNGASNYYTHNGDKLWLLNRNSNNSYASEASISDVRIYATALSDTDILELYNTSASIDNKGNMFGYEFNEENSSSENISKAGIIKIDNLVEYSDDKIKILDDGSVFMQILYHNNPKDQLFTQSNCWANNVDGLYSGLNILKSSIYNQLSKYEFIAYEKLTSSSTETIFRWSQTSNPALTSTITGKTIISGSVVHNEGLKNNGTNAAMHNGNAWWCACGCWTPYQGGIPGFNGVITTGYLKLYVRIPESIFNDTISGGFDNFLKFYQKTILANQLIEI